MKNKYKFYTGIILVSTILVTACGGSVNTDGLDKENSQALNKKLIELEQENQELLDKNKILIVENKELELQLNNNPISNNGIQSLMDIALDVMELIRDKDMVALSTHVHPSKGVRFTPYVHINRPFDQVFTSQEVANLDQDTTIYNWGYYYDGTSSEINLDFNDYYDEFIYDEDFLNVNTIGINAVVSWGVMIDNIYDEYDNGDYLEFYIPGLPHKDGSYWRSLKLVFEESKGQQFLVGVIHGQWTDLYGSS